MQKRRAKLKETWSEKVCGELGCSVFPLGAKNVGRTVCIICRLVNGPGLMVEFPANHSALLWEIVPFPHSHSLLFFPWDPVQVGTDTLGGNIHLLSDTQPLPMANSLGLPGAEWALGNPRDVTPSRKILSGLKACVCSALPSLFLFLSLSPSLLLCPSL